MRVYGVASAVCVAVTSSLMNLRGTGPAVHHHGGACLCCLVGDPQRHKLPCLQHVSWAWSLSTSCLVLAAQVMSVTWRQRPASPCRPFRNQLSQMRSLDAGGCGHSE